MGIDKRKVNTWREGCSGKQKEQVQRKNERKKERGKGSEGKNMNNSSSQRTRNKYQQKVASRLVTTLQGSCVLVKAIKRGKEKNSDAL